MHTALVEPSPGPVPALTEALDAARAYAERSLTASTRRCYARDIGQGVPLALNSYAGASAYAPYIGAAATERFGLPYRSLFVNHTLSTR